MNPQSPQPPVPSTPQPAINPRQQVVERLDQAMNVLVTVSNNPTVDQLSACIGFTVMLNKLGKHATAVFSGAVPSTIEFLKPEQTLKKNTDSLRDFIIALDKSKADKLRYKIEDKFVKIFITPYRSSISEEDLEFSEGDFNVDVVVALGVHRREELDQAITAHGRILHDATVISVNTNIGAAIGTINWRDDKSSSLSEMLVGVGETLKAGLLDAQIATAFLTGIVAETNRFSNAKTSAQTMSVAAKLINAGANQQLIATKLEPPKPIPPPEAVPNSSNSSITVPKTNEPVSAAQLPKPDDGSLRIPHDEDQVEVGTAYEPAEEKLDQIDIDEQGTLRREAELAKEMKQREDDQKTAAPSSNPNSRMILDPPSTGGTLTANSQPEVLEPSLDPLIQSSGQPSVLPDDSPAAPNENALEDNEKSVQAHGNEPNEDQLYAQQLNAARQKVDSLAEGADIRKRKEGMGTLPLDQSTVDLQPEMPVDPEDLPAGERKLETHDPLSPPPGPPPPLPPPIAGAAF